MVWFVKSLSQVCHKFVKSLHSQPQTNAPSNRNHTRFGFIGWLINRIYNKQQYNDQSVNCCKQPIPKPKPLLFHIPIPIPILL